MKKNEILKNHFGTISRQLRPQNQPPETKFSMLTHNFKIQMTSDFKYAIRNTRVRDGRILKIIILWVITARYC